MAEGQSLAEASRVVNTRKVPVPGATPYIPPTPSENAPEYIVVDQPYFNGKLYEIGERVATNAPIIPKLGSPGRYLMPVNHKGPWPPKEYVDADRAARKKARDEWIKDIARKY
jgi:hypothetical protein